MKEFGGYFGLELHNGPHTYHNANLSLKSGRSSLHYILNYVKPSMVYLPFYTCNALLEPFEVTGVPYKFYEINEMLEPISLPKLSDNEYFIYINYFDLKRRYSDYLSGLYGHKLIVDCTQAFFMKGNGKSWFFNSCRKFFGTPDGSYLYAPIGEVLPIITELNEHYITDHLLNRFNGHTVTGYSYFSINETYCDSTILGMSKLSTYLLSNIDYEYAIRRRKLNYKKFQHFFSGLNDINLDIDEEMVPMFYPLVTAKLIDKKELHQKKIFIPYIWNDVLTRQENGYLFEKALTSRLISLPVDHRYMDDDIQKVIDYLSDLL